MRPVINMALAKPLVFYDISYLARKGRLIKPSCKTGFKPITVSSFKSQSAQLLPPTQRQANQYR